MIAETLPELFLLCATGAGAAGLFAVCAPIAVGMVVASRRLSRADERVRRQVAGEDDAVVRLWEARPRVDEDTDCWGK